MGLHFYQCFSPFTNIKMIDIMCVGGGRGGKNLNGWVTKKICFPRKGVFLYLFDCVCLCPPSHGDLVYTSSLSPPTQSTVNSQTNAFVMDMFNIRWGGREGGGVPPIPINIVGSSIQKSNQGGE